MGEAYYHLLAEFSSHTDMWRAEKLIKPVLKQMIAIEDEWQELRGTGNPLEIYDRLMKKYPLIKVFFKLPIPKKSDKSLNAWSGLIDMTEDYHLTTKGKVLRLSCEVWHFADWSMLVNIFYKLGAIHCQYYSDEYIDDWIDDLNIKKYSKDIEPLTKEELDAIMVELL